MNHRAAAALVLATPVTNIGGAPMIFLAGPLVLALVVAAAGNARYEGRRR